MYKNYFKYTALVIALLIANVLFAQVDPSTPKVPPPPPGLPIDGGIVGLLLIGIGYAVKKLREK